MIAAVLITVGFVAIQSTIAPAPQAEAAVGSSFDPGEIISDDIFYNRRTMNVDQIQSFLNAKEPSCASGYTCLKNYYETTRSRAADGGCAAYGGQNESAARIIYKVATACGINPQVILATLEKEQGLVTSRAPGSYAYRSAMGYGCPDTAPCDSQYYGFYNQVYKAAWQFKVYQRYPTSFNFVAGRTNTIQWNPNSSCGSSRVYIKNQATAGLYAYTPYRPNPAALTPKNLYGTGDGCSSYGNRNFWVYFSDWFGSTKSNAVDPLLASYYQQQGGVNGKLGAPIKASDRYPDGGVGQQFTNYRVYWSQATGFDLTTGRIGQAYAALGGAGGSLGYPTGVYTSHANGGRSQTFQNGDYYWSPTTDVYFTTGLMRAEYNRLKGPDGVLGYPAAAYGVVASVGRMQKFQNATMFWSPSTQIEYTTGGIGTQYIASGGPSGAMGFPTGTYGFADGGGRSQQFQNGTYYWSAKTDSHYMAAPLVVGYGALGGLVGPYGYPVADSVSYGDSIYGVQLQAGALYTSAAGSFLTTGAIGVEYLKLGGPKSALGAPTGAYTASGDARIQKFQNGTMYWTARTGAHYVLSGLASTYSALGGGAGSWGYPIADSVVYTGGGLSQAMGAGWILWSAETDGFATTGILGAYYMSTGGPRGVLGYPTGPYTVAGTSRTQQFAKGKLTWTPAHGVVRS